MQFNICGASALVTLSASGLVPFRVIDPNSKPVKILSVKICDNISSLLDESVNDSVLQTTPHQYYQASETETDYDVSMFHGKRRHAPPPIIFVSRSNRQIASLPLGNFSAMDN